MKRHGKKEHKKEAIDTSENLSVLLNMIKLSKKTLSSTLVAHERLK